MNIYFAASIRGGRDDVHYYEALIKELQKYGTVLTEHVGLDSLTDKGETILGVQEIHDRDLAWVDEADILVAEVTNPSLGVGYEIAYALSTGKRVIALFRTSSDKKLSAMIAGSRNIENYTYKEPGEFQALLQQLFKQ